MCKVAQMNSHLTRCVPDAPVQAKVQRSTVSQSDNEWGVQGSVLLLLKYPFLAHKTLARLAWRDSTSQMCNREPQYSMSVRQLWTLLDHTAIVHGR